MESTVAVVDFESDGYTGREVFLCMYTGQEWAGIFFAGIAFAGLMRDAKFRPKKSFRIRVLRLLGPAGYVDARK